MTVSDQIRNAALSYARLFVGACLTAYLMLGKAPLDLGMEDAKALLNAGLGALAVTAFNALRPGEKRFGVGADADA